MEVQDLNDFNNDSLVSVIKMALAISRNATLDEFDTLDIVANFRNPLMPSIASQADAMVKIASVVPDFASTEVFWEMVGLSEDMRQKVVQQMDANANRNAIAALMSGTTEAAQ